MVRVGVLLLLVVSCGGRSRENTPEGESGTAAQAGRSGEWSFGSGGNGGSGDASGGTGLASSFGGAIAEAGAPSDEPGALIGSGARYCENDTYCFGFTCYVPEHLYDRVCVSDCETSADCGEHETCLSSPTLRSTCYRICEHTSDCGYGFDCFDFTLQHEQLVCFPTKWAEYWRTHEL